MMTAHYLSIKWVIRRRKNSPSKNMKREAKNNEPESAGAKYRSLIWLNEAEKGWWWSWRGESVRRREGDLNGRRSNPQFLRRFVSSSFGKNQLLLVFRFTSIHSFTFTLGSIRGTRFIPDLPALPFIRATWLEGTTCVWLQSAASVAPTATLYHISVIILIFPSVFLCLGFLSFV